MPARERASSLPCSSQADLLRGRGDLRGTSARFRVNLHAPSHAVISAEPLARMGMEVKRDPSNSRLVIEDVDNHPRQRTPVAQWNIAERRQADRGEGERHQNLAIKPGDRIKEVNDLNSATLMLGALEEAADGTEPQNVSLQVSRDISNVLAPSPPRPVSSAMVSAPEWRVGQQDYPSGSRPITTNSPGGARPPRLPPRSPARPIGAGAIGKSDGSSPMLRAPSPMRAREGEPRSPSPTPSLASRSPSSSRHGQRATSTGPWERKMRTSLSYAGLHALRP